MYSSAAQHGVKTVSRCDGKTKTLYYQNYRIPGGTAFSCRAHATVFFET